MPQCATMGSFEQGSLDTQVETQRDTEPEESVTLELPQEQPHARDNVAGLPDTCGVPKALAPLSGSVKEDASQASEELAKARARLVAAEQRLAEAEANLCERRRAAEKELADESQAIARAEGAAGLATVPAHTLAAREADALQRKPAASASRTGGTRQTPRAPTLSGRACLAILKRLDAVGGLPTRELQTLAQKVKRAAGRRKKTEQAKAAPLLGDVLAQLSAALEADVQRMQLEFDEACNAVDNGQKAHIDAEESLKEAQSAELEAKVLLKEAEEASKEGGKAARIGASAEMHLTAEADTKGMQSRTKELQAEIKAMQGQKRQLEDVAENVYRPLKEARVEESSEAKRRISLLCKVGKKHGLHPELLSVAPAILRKELDKRQTFDRLAVESLDKEFTKHVDAMQARIQEGERALQKNAEAFEAQQVAVQAARMQRKEAAQKLAAAVAAVGLGKEAVAQSRKHMKSLPAAIKKAQRDFEKAKSRVSKFRCGPLAAYMRVLPLPEVRRDTVEPQDMDVDA